MATSRFSRVSLARHTSPIPSAPAGEGFRTEPAYRGATGSVRRLSWFDRQGKPQGFAGEPAVYNDVALSHDGTRVATSQIDVASTDIDIWVQEFARQTNSRLTTARGLDLAPVWSPHDDRIAFNRGVLYQKAFSGGPE